jgi:GNAT superfamily N-acetyltransferase
MSRTTGVIKIRRARPLDLDTVTGLLADAFLRGDLGPWLIPDPGTRADIYPPYFEILAEHALDHGQVDLIDDVGVAVWYDLGATAQPVIRDYDTRLAATVGPNLPRFQALDKAMHQHHPDDESEPHHYLALLGVHPDEQGQGYGGALLRHHHHRLDADRVRVYLEATGRRNRTLYARYGYRTRPAYQPASDSPPLYPMWREPQPRQPPRETGGPNAP